MQTDALIQFDDGREARIALPEAVYGESKPDEALFALFERFAAPTARPILFTRIAPERFARLDPAVARHYDYDALSRTAFNARLTPKSGCAAVVTAGTADAAVAREAMRTLEYLGYDTHPFFDCGVAGLWRIQKAAPAIDRCDVVILVAGLDAALASVLGGLTQKPVFAVPTSVGYGAAQGGQAALNAMLASCAPGVAVMNIDNGYGAACAAARVLHLLEAAS